MPIGVIDSRIFRNLFGTNEIRKIFDDEKYASYMVEVETALARAQSKLNVIPADVGGILTKTCDASKLDLLLLGKETEIVGYPVLPLIKQLQEMCPAESSKYIHWGATTQDIMDTATVLQIRDGLHIVSRELDELKGILRKLAEKYRNIPMAGRTHLQQALPITFGYKCAVYLSSLQRHSNRIEELKARVFIVQFGGAAGTMASLGPDDTGLRLRQELASELKLGNPPITWHVCRDNIAELVNFLALVGGSLGKIALDLMLMSSNEISEVSEPFLSHRGASSTMPQKRNPISSEIVLAVSKMLRANSGLALDAMVCDFERASGPWHLEWAAVPESFVLISGALHQTSFALAGLVVNESNMIRNLESTQGLIVSEAVMMGLAPFIGRQAAHDVVYQACRRCVETGRAFADVLMEVDIVKAKVFPAEISRLCDPRNYLGACGSMVDSVLAAQ